MSDFEHRKHTHAAVGRKTYERNPAQIWRKMKLARSENRVDTRRKIDAPRTIRYAKIAERTTPNNIR